MRNRLRPYVPRMPGMPVQRLYIYRLGATNACALTGEKGDSRLPAPVAPDRWQFWMQTSRDQTENGLYGYAEEPAVTQIAAKGFCFFTGSIRLLDGRRAAEVGSSPRADAGRRHGRDGLLSTSPHALRLRGPSRACRRRPISSRYAIGDRRLLDKTFLIADQSLLRAGEPDAIEQSSTLYNRDL